MFYWIIFFFTKIEGKQLASYLAKWPIFRFKSLASFTNIDSDKYILLCNFSYCYLTVPFFFSLFDRYSLICNKIPCSSLDNKWFVASHPVITSTSWFEQWCGQLIDAWRTRRSGAATRLLMWMSHFLMMRVMKPTKLLRFLKNKQIN